MRTVEPFNLLHFYSEHQTLASKALAEQSPGLKGKALADAATKLVVSAYQQAAKEVQSRDTWIWGAVALAGAAITGASLGNKQKLGNRTGLFASLGGAMITISAAMLGERTAHTHCLMAQVGNANAPQSPDHAGIEHFDIVGNGKFESYDPNALGCQRTFARAERILEKQLAQLRI